MLNQNNLSLISQQLRSNTSLALDLAEILKEIIKDRRYVSWLESDFLAGQQFLINENDPKNQLLCDLNLVKQQKLQVKVHSFQEKVFLTDGLWVPKKYLVFPFYDESSILVTHAQKHQFDNSATSIVDPACGCGHHVLLFPQIQQKYSLDVNERALSYTSINSIINESQNITIKNNDISNGIPDEFGPLIGESVLFLINMPFAISPLPNVLPLTTDGGVTGAKWTFKALEAVYQFALKTPNKSSIHASILCYTMGNKKQDRWEVVDKAVQLFGSSKVTWKVLENKTMWRINGKKEQPNPMNLAQGLPKKANCQFQVNDDDRERVRVEYQNLAQSLNDGGWEYLGYGILDIHL